MPFTVSTTSPAANQETFSFEQLSVPVIVAETKTDPNPVRTPVKEPTTEPFSPPQPGRTAPVPEGDPDKRYPTCSF